MSKSPSSGHHTNVSNFNKLITCCASYGETYNPIWADLKIDALQKMADEADKCLKALQTVEGQNKTAIAARKTSFGQLSALLPRLMGAIRISEIPESIVDSLQSAINTILGRNDLTEAEKAARKAEKESLLAAGKSARQRSLTKTTFDSKLEGLASVIAMLEEAPGYATNEKDLTLAALKAVYASLAATHTAANKSNLDKSNARSTRNTCMYGKDKGMVKVAQKVKDYVKSVYTANSPQYKQVSSISFVRYKS